MSRNDHFNDGAGVENCDTCGMVNHDATRRKVFGTGGCPTCGHNIPFDISVSSQKSPRGNQAIKFNGNERPYWSKSHGMTAGVGKESDGWHAFGEGPKGDVSHQGSSRTEAVHGVVKKMAAQIDNTWEPLHPTVKKKIKSQRDDD